MGCNTSQEQPSAVSENNGDIVNHNNDTKQTPRNSAKSEKESKSAKSTKSAKSDKLTNGHDNQTSDDQKSEGMTTFLIQFIQTQKKLDLSRFFRVCVTALFILCYVRVSQSFREEEKKHTSCDTNSALIYSFSKENEYAWGVPL